VSLRILAAGSPGEVRVAVTRSGRLEDYAIWRPGSPDGVDDLYRGRITARVPAMAGAFVALGGAEGFLPDSQGGAGATEGQHVAVRVTRAAQGGKGPRLTARLDDADHALADQAGPGQPRLLRRGPGAVLQFARLHPEAPVLVDDAALAAGLRPALGDRVRLGAGLFEDALAGEIDELSEPRVALPGGAALHIHPTPALVAIDVDLGSATALRDGKTAAQMAVNRALLPWLTRQIRLRNLSGAILVDFAGLSPRRRAALGPALAEALAADPLRPRLLGFTALGLAEIVRSRVRPPLHELLSGPHAAGLAALRVAAAEGAAHPERPPALRAAPALVAALQADAVALSDLARRAGRPLILRADPALAPNGWRMEQNDERSGA
jgi:Ribonuclease G/E